MSGVRRDSSADAFAEFASSRTEPDMKISGYDAKFIREALEEADAALKQARQTKSISLQRQADNARSKVIRAHAVLSKAATA